MASKKEESAEKYKTCDAKIVKQTDLAKAEQRAAAILAIQEQIKNADMPPSLGGVCLNDTHPCSVCVSTPAVYVLAIDFCTEELCSACMRLVDPMGKIKFEDGCTVQ